MEVGNYLGIKGHVNFQVLGKIIIKDGVTINSGNKFNPIGSGFVTNIIVKNNAKLYIGNSVGISNSTIFCTKSIEIHDCVKIGGGCRIWDTYHHSNDANDRLAIPEKKPVSGNVVLNKGCWLGADVLILPNVEIGENSVVGAASVVTKSIPSNEIWAGNPARFVRKCK